MILTITENAFGKQTVRLIFNITFLLKYNLKVHNHLIGQILNMSIYITNIEHIYNPNINLSKFEPLKPSHSRDISLLVFYF